MDGNFAVYGASIAGRRKHMPKGLIRSLAMPVVISVAVAACSSAQHQNVAHPDYGDAKYFSDLADCRRQHSTVVTSQGYDIHSEVTTDQAKVDICMAELGWRTVSR
jgi:hypothetical protein